MKRVLLVFDPPDGGVAENVRRLALGLSEFGWAPYVAGPRESLIYEDLREAGIPLVRLPLRPGYDHLISDIRSLRALARIGTPERFDVIHSHNAKAGVLSRIAASRSGVPAIYSPHCFPFVAPFSPPRLLVSTLIEWGCGRLTDMLLCVAGEEREQALSRRIVSPDRLRVVYNGCPPCSTEELDGDLEGFRAGRPLAATQCVLREQKAVDVFVAAAPAVLERCPDAALAVVGNGELLEPLKAQAASLGLDEDRFGFFPFRQPAARQLASMDVFVLPSAWEAFPISVLEAMACGVPQVATDVGGTSEALIHGETGLLAPPGDPAALADRISELLADPERRERMAATSVERYEAMFRVETMVEKTAALYEELAR